MYSQNNEEQVILDYFKNQSQGTFLDVGANDGITLSNTRALFEKGWLGVLVEPSPTAFTKLAKLYEGTLNELFNAAVVDLDIEEIELLDSNEHLGKGDTSLLSTVVPSEVERWGKTQIFTPIKVKASTIKKIIEKSSIKTFDFISIDCEGLDLVILKELLPYIQDTKLICIEFNNKPSVKNEILSLLPEFKLIHQNYENLILAK